MRGQHALKINGLDAAHLRATQSVALLIETVSCPTERELLYEPFDGNSPAYGLAGPLPRTPHRAGGYLDPVSEFLSESMMASHVAMTVGATNRGKLREQIVFLRSSNHRVYFLSVTHGHVDSSALFDAIGQSLACAPTSPSRLDEVENQLGYTHECSIRFLEEDPRNLASWKLDAWRCQRIAELAVMSGFKTTGEISACVENEASELHRGLQAEIETHVSRLDVDVCQFRSVPGISWLHQYNFLAHEDRTIRRNRQQALELFPLLVQEILLRREQDAAVRALADAIDNGLPLIEVAAKVFVCKQVAVRRIQHLSEHDIGDSWRGNLRPLFFLLSRIPPEHYPKTSGDWRNLARGVALITATTRNPITTLSTGHLLADVARRRWVLDQRNQLSAVDRTRAIEALIADLSRSLTLHLSLQKTVTSCARSHAYELASNAIRSLSMKRIGALAQRWFAAKQRFEMGLLADQSVNFSLRLLEEPFQTSGGSVVQLLSRSELRHEARQLQHCVENYSEACAKGRSLIFSIRNQSGESRSTVELSISERGLSRYSIDVVQHKGIGNTAPTVEDAVVLKSFLEFLRGPFLRSQLRVFCITRNFANIHASLGTSAVKEYQLSLLLSKTLADASRGQIVFDSLLEKTIKNAMGENC